MSKLQCVKFGDMVHQITTKVNPKDTSLNTYVGLEHLDTGSLRIKRRGSPQDVIGEKLRVCKGDIIFGKRRVYQRKLAIADFDGICSAHAMVLRPKEDIVDKEFFPFFMQSDLFMERALQISVGSLSPTINWKTLGEQEFTISPLPVQRRIATTLWAAEDCIVKGERFVAAAERAKQVLMGELFSKGIGHREFKELKGFGKVPKEWDNVKLGELAEKFLNGGTPSTNNTDYWKGDIPWTTSAPLNDFYLNRGEKYISKLGLENSASNLIPKGNIIVASRVGVGKVVLNKIDVAISQDLTGLIVDKSRVIPEYLVWYLLSPRVNKQIVRSAQGTTIMGVTRDKFEKIPIPLPPLPEQHQIAGILTRCDEAIIAARANVTVAKALKMKMINEMLGAGN